MNAMTLLVLRIKWRTFQMDNNQENRRIKLIVKNTLLKWIKVKGTTIAFMW